MKMAFVILLIPIFLSIGCVQNNTAGNNTVPENITTIQSFDDCVKAGNPVIETYPRECDYKGTTFLEENCQDNNGNVLTLGDAIEIAKESDCGDNLTIDCTCPEGFVKEGSTCNPACYYSEPRCLQPSVACEKSYFCNQGTGTYWINMNITKEDCSPVCVIDLKNVSVEINWRCTGLIVP